MRYASVALLLASAVGLSKPLVASADQRAPKAFVLAASLFTSVAVLGYSTYYSVVAYAVLCMLLL